MSDNLRSHPCCIVEYYTPLRCGTMDVENEFHLLLGYWARGSLDSIALPGDSILDRRFLGVVHFPSCRPLHHRPSLHDRGNLPKPARATSQCFRIRPVVKLPPSRLAKHSQTPDAYASRTYATSTVPSCTVSRSPDKPSALQDRSRRQNKGLRRNNDEIQTAVCRYPQGREPREGENDAMVLRGLVLARERGQSDA